MKNTIHAGITIALTCLMSLAVPAQEATPVAQHGRLQVSGSKLVGQSGEVVNLRGTSLFWSQWSTPFYNGKVVDWLVQDWKVNLVRAAMGVNGANSGYLANPAAEMARVDTIVAAAVRNGIYVIIDWHDHEADKHLQESKAFFATMAERYGHLPNVIWEVWNEPLDTAQWLATIKPYGEAVLQSIRQHDPDNLVVVGTRSWSQRVDEVIGHAISDGNVAYTLHFYVGSHGDWLRGIGDQAIAAGLPLFVTEWGIWDMGYVDGDYTQSVDVVQTMAWLDWMEAHKLSGAMWSVNDKDEPSALLKGGANPLGSWTAEDLTSAGTFMRAYFRGKYDGSWVLPEIPPRVIDTLDLPGVLEAEDFANMSGIQVESTQDSRSAKNIGYIEDGDWADYHVKVGTAGSYPMVVRYASAGVGGTLVVSLDGVPSEPVELAVTGDWQGWQEVLGSITLPQGLHVLRLDFRGAAGEALFNLNYLDIGNTLTPAVPGLRLRVTQEGLRMGRFDLLGRFSSTKQSHEYQRKGE